MYEIARHVRNGPVIAKTAAALALTLVAGAVGFTAFSSSGQAATTGTIVGTGSGRCVAVPSSSSASGTQLVLWDCDATSNQALTVNDAGQIQVLGKCLDASGARTAAGTKVILWSCHGRSNQRWTVTPGTGTIKGVGSGLCLDAYRAGTANGTMLQLWGCHGGRNQSWRSPSAATPTPSPSSTSTPGSTSASSSTSTPTSSRTTTPSSTTTTRSTSTATTSPPNSTCSVAPVDPQATRQARNLLCYVYSQYGNHILSGQQESGATESEINYVFSNTGKYPAIRGMDLGDSPTLGNRAAAWWNAGGIPMIGYHMGSPAQGTDGYTGSQLNANINAALTPGTADYQRFTSRLDLAAAQLLTVQNAGGAVIFRPFHEAGGTWFWWSKEGGAQYNRLWTFTFDYLTKTKGVHNLVWLHPYNGQPGNSFYPGKSYVDIGGADTYAGDHGPLTPMFNTTRNIVGTTIPIALHENGRIPDPDQLQSTGTRWVLFNTWHTTWIKDTSINPVSLIQKVYGSSYVVTRDEVPNLR